MSARHAARRAKKRDTNEPEIVAFLEAIGCTVERLDVVDLLVGYRGKNHLLEVKNVKVPGMSKHRHELKDSQREWHASWRGQVAVVRTKEDCLRALGLEP